jgi:hypothetical protein
MPEHALNGLHVGAATHCERCRRLLQIVQHHSRDTGVIEGSFPPRFGRFARSHTSHEPAESVIKDESSRLFASDYEGQ